MASYKLECKHSCINEIKVRLKDDIIKEINVDGGCSCMFSAFNQLISNRNIDEVIGLLKSVNLSCVNKEPCIEKLIILLEKAKIEEEKKVKKEQEYRLSLPGFYKSISTLYAKPKIPFDKKYVLIKASSDSYGSILEVVSNLPDYVSQLLSEENESFTNKYHNLTSEKEKEELLKIHEESCILFNKIIEQLPFIQIEENNEFEGDYIFNTKFKDGFTKI